MEQRVLNVELRENTGKGVCRRLRASGLIPGVVYGKGMEAVPVTVNPSLSASNNKLFNTGKVLLFDTALWASETTRDNSAFEQTNFMLFLRLGSSIKELYKLVAVVIGPVDGVGKAIHVRPVWV